MLRMLLRILRIPLMYPGGYIYYIYLTLKTEKKRKKKKVILSPFTATIIPYFAFLVKYLVKI